MEEIIVPYGPFLEEWERIPKYPDYFVSNYGRVRSFRRWTSGRLNSAIKDSKGKILNLDISTNPKTNEKSYARVTISNEKGTKRFSVHKLVCLCFVPNPENKPQGNHKDGDKLNNAFYNLEWSTQSENVQHAINILGKTLGTRTKVLNTRTGEIFNSCREAYNSSNKRYCYVHFRTMIRKRYKHPNKTPFIAIEDD